MLGLGQPPCQSCIPILKSTIYALNGIIMSKTKVLPCCPQAWAAGNSKWVVLSLVMKKWRIIPFGNFKELKTPAAHLAIRVPLKPKWITEHPSFLPNSRLLEQHGLGNFLSLETWLVWKHEADNCLVIFDRESCKKFIFKFSFLAKSATMWFSAIVFSASFWPVWWCAISLVLVWYVFSGTLT